VLFTVFSLFWFLAGATSLREGVFADLFTKDIALDFEKFALNYAMDTFFIGIVIAISCYGRRKGFLETLGGLVRFGSIVFACYCLYLPFSPQAGNTDKVLLYGLTSRCMAAMNEVLNPGWSFVGDAVGKLLAGILLLASVLAIYALLNWLFARAVNWAKNHRFTRNVDGVLAFVIWFFISLAVCFVVWTVWYLFARHGIFNVDELIGEKASLSSGMFRMLEGLLEPIL